MGIILKSRSRLTEGDRPLKKLGILGRPKTDPERLRTWTNKMKPGRNDYQCRPSFDGRRFLREQFQPRTVQWTTEEILARTVKFIDGLNPSDSDHIIFI